MMPAYDALMNQRPGAQPGMKATPVHHILEEQADPITGQPTVVGSDWRNQASAKVEEWRKLAYDPSVPTHMRKQYQALANQLDVDIGEEDAFHAQQKEALGPMQATDAFAELQKRKAQGREGAYNPLKGLSTQDAMTKGWRPPVPGGR